MKKIILVSIAIIGFSVLIAQTPNDVPNAVKISFQKEYKNTTAEWAILPEYYVAKWDNKSKQMTAYYAKTNDATLVRTETDVQLTELSEATQHNITSRFLASTSTYTLIRAFKIENYSTSTEGCEMNMGNGNHIRLYFDANGELTKRELTK